MVEEPAAGRGNSTGRGNGAGGSGSRRGAAEPVSLKQVDLREGERMTTHIGELDRVLGGGIMAQKEFLKERIERAVSKHLMPEIFRNTKLAFAKHGNDAGMLGAFYHFRQRHRVE